MNSPREGGERRRELHRPPCHRVQPFATFSKDNEVLSHAAGGRTIALFNKHGLMQLRG